MKKTKFLKAFTLAEVMATVIILGVIAAITIPTTLHRVTERQNKTRVRKALSTYQTLVEKMVIENNIPRNNQSLNNWARGENNDCAPARRYLKGTRDGATPCIFRSADGLWYNITDISNTLIGFDDNGRPTNVSDGGVIAAGDETRAFTLVTSFDQNGSVRVQDKGYEENGINNNDKKWATRKVQCYLDNENCQRLRDICLGEGNNRRCIQKEISNNAADCRIYMGWVLRLNGRGNGAVNIQPQECSIDKFKDNNNNFIGKLVCGTDTQSGKHGCITAGGGYSCEVTTPDEIQCHINGGEVSDISYNMKGEVTNVQCNSWNESCRQARNGNVPSPMACPSALCSFDWDEETWKVMAGEEDKFFFVKAICELIQMQGRKVPDSCSAYMQE